MPPTDPRSFDEKGRLFAPGIERPGDMTPISVKLPSLASMSGLSDADLLEVAQRYGVYDPWRDLFASNAAYVQQYSKLAPGTPAFWDEVQRITDPESSSRAALGMARSGARNYNQILATDGDESRILVRVGEGDDSMCAGCQEKEGVEGTYAEHDAEGLPGTQECGANCRCVLIPVEDQPAGVAGGDEEAGFGEMLLYGLLAAAVIDSILDEADVEE